MAIAVRNEADLGITIDDSGGYRTILIPQAARALANILVPVSSTIQENPIWRPSLHKVYLDHEFHTYPEKGERAITKNGLLLLAAAAGIDVLELGRMKRDVLEDGEVGYEAKIQWRRADGTLATMVGSCAAMRSKADPKIPEKCETKALLRAIRAALQIPSKMTADQLAKPFVVVVYTFAPDTSNPETLRTLIAAGTKGAATMYGTPALESPDEFPPVGTALGELPPGDETDADADTANRVAAESDPEPSSPPERSASAPNPDLGNIVLDFGKHKGKTITAVYAMGDGYIEWLRDNAREAGLKQQCADFLATIGGES